MINHPTDTPEIPLLAALEFHVRVQVGGGDDGREEGAEERGELGLAHGKEGQADKLRNVSARLLHQIVLLEAQPFALGVAFLEGAELLGVVPELLGAFFQALRRVADALDDASHERAWDIRVGGDVREGAMGSVLRPGHREDGE